jgi:TetR/AcrR family transcriptional regulator
MSARTPRASSEALRERIRDEAARLFAQHGFAGTSVQAVADAVGISKQALLYHFPSKADLKHAVFSVALDTWVEVLPLLLEAVATPGDQLDPVLDRLVLALDETRDAARFVLRVLMDDDRSAFRELAAGSGPWLVQATGLVQAGIAAGTFSAEVDAEAWLIEVGLHLLVSIALADITERGGLFPGELMSWRRRRLRQAIRMAQLTLRP